MRRLLRPMATIALMLAGQVEAAAPADSPNIVRFTFLHMNDVYVIQRPAGDSLGGLSRVAALRNRLVQENPATTTVLSGDFLSPSAINGVVVDGKELAGRPMVMVLNALKLDFATFGNHEFDVTEQQLSDRIREANFRWISSNVLNASGKPFAGLESSRVITFRGVGGEEVRVGLFGLTINSNKARFVSYKDPILEAHDEVAALKGKCDIVIALTHLNIETDRRIAQEVPGIQLILGGHEHVHNYEIRYQSNHYLPPIAKADANARTVYIHRLAFDLKTRELEIRSQLYPVQGVPTGGPNTDGIPADVDPTTERLVRRLRDLAYKALKLSFGLNPDDVLAQTEYPLDGRDSSVRFRSTNLTRLLGQAFLFQARDSRPRAAVYNCGSIRIDDIIEAGPIQVIDVFRTLPYKAKLITVPMDGQLLVDLLTTGARIQGQGGFLQTVGVATDPAGRWTIEGEPITPGFRYPVVTNDFLLHGLENGYGDPDNPVSINGRLHAIWTSLPQEVKTLKPGLAGEDLETRRAVIDYLRAQSKIAIAPEGSLDPDLFPSKPIDHPTIRMLVDPASRPVRVN